MKALLLVAAAGAAAFPARADVVELRNGASLEGEVVAETDTMVTLRFQGGQVTFERKLVAAIRKQPWQEAPKPSDPKPEPAKTDAPVPGGVRDDGPRFVPTDGAPGKPDAPKPEAPKTDAPKPESPKAETPAPLPAAGPITPAKDDWTLLWSAERRTGWCRAQAKVDESGKSIFEWETAVLGRNGKPEGTIRYVEEAGPGFSPLGFLLATDTPGRQSSRSGRVRDGRLTIETWENGEKAMRDLPVPDGMRLPLAARALVLREASGPGASWMGPTFDPREGEFTTAKISLVRRERFPWEGKDLDTVVLTRTLGAATTEERVAADGRVLQAGFGADGGSAIGTTAARVEALRTSTVVEEASEAERGGRMSIACPEDGFRIRKPGVSWILGAAESKESRERASVKDFSGTVSVAVEAEAAAAGPEKVPSELGAAVETRLRKECPSYARVEAGAATLGGTPSWSLVADTEVRGNPVRVLVHVVARSGRVFTVTATAPRASYAEARPWLQRILDGIEWL